MNMRKPMQLRLPAELKDWLRDQASTNSSSLNSEVIRAIRERIERINPNKA